MMSGDKDRYSIAAFVIPNEGTIIKTPKELIDDQHPRLFKDFDFMEFFLFAFSDPAKHIDNGELLHVFAGLSPPSKSNWEKKSCLESKSWLPNRRTRRDVSSLLVKMSMQHLPGIFIAS
ncbi:hypothetical protein Gotur_023089 [Gossypium turneri]